MRVDFLFFLMMTEQNPVGWFEIYVSDLNRAKSFYEAAFKYKLERMPTGGDFEMYSFPMFEKAQNAPGALVEGTTDMFKPGKGGTLVYFTVDDLSVVLGRVEGAGGKIIRPKFPIGQYGFIGFFKDTEGNVVGVHSMK